MVSHHDVFPQQVDSYILKNRWYFERTKTVATHSFSCALFPLCILSIKHLQVEDEKDEEIDSWSITGDEVIIFYRHRVTAHSAKDVLHCLREELCSKAVSVMEFKAASAQSSKRRDFKRPRVYYCPLAQIKIS